MGAEYKVWEVPRTSHEPAPGRYLVDNVGAVKYRVEKGTFFDLSKRLPAAWNESVWPSVGAFGVMTLLLFLCGMGIVLRANDPHVVEVGVTAREENL